MEREIIRNCFVCKGIGRKRPDIDLNGRYNKVPVVRCYTRARCCDKYVYVHDKAQTNSNIELDCENRLNEMSADAYRQGICLICKKRFRWNIWEYIAFSLLITFLMFIWGSAIGPSYPAPVQILMGFASVFGIAFVILVLVGIVIWFNARNSDVPEDGLNNGVYDN